MFGIISIAGGSLIDKYGVKLLARVGLILLATGAAIFTTLFSHYSFALYLFDFVLIGVGMGFAVTALNAGAIMYAQQEYIGVASSLIIMGCLIGNALGLTITVGAYSHFKWISLHDYLGLQYVMYAVCVLCIVAAYFSGPERAQIDEEIMVDGALNAD